MRFPATIHLRVIDTKEYETVMAALQAATPALGEVIDKIKITEAGGPPKDLPDAYLIVDGRRIAEGTRVEMEEAFKTEIAAHRAAVTLMARPPGSLEYKQARSRVIPAMTAT